MRFQGSLSLKGHKGAAVLDWSSCGLTATTTRRSDGEAALLPTASVDRSWASCLAYSSSASSILLAAHDCASGRTSIPSLLVEDVQVATSPRLVGGWLYSLWLLMSRGDAVSGSIADRLSRAAVVTACVQAANVWFESSDSLGSRWRRVAELHGVVGLAHVTHDGRLLPLAEFVRGLEGRLADVLPGAFREESDQFPLVEDGELSEAAFDVLRENLAPSATAQRVAEWEWETLSAEKIQGWLYGRLLETGSQAGYEAARLAVINHAAGELVAINDVIKQVALPREGLYEPIPAWAWVAHGGERYWFACPLCGWPMRFQLDRVSCRYPPHTQVLGSLRVWWGRAGTPQVGAARRGAQPEAEARPVEEHVCLVHPVWRYSTIPGLAERDLARELAAIGGIEVQLWPQTDAYDLRILVAGTTWERRGDVKDYADPGRLAGALSSKRSLRDSRMVIIVPLHRARQVGLLNERLQEAFGQPRRRFAMTTTEFLRSVKRAAAKAGEQR
jgi:REase associating with pPIWI_RE